MENENIGINKTAIESFIINNNQLSKIESHLNRFNPIKIMKMETMEIRHSSILSWLLNPRENHGLHDEFLRCFLAETLKNSDKETEISAIELFNANLHDANVYTEWNQIDIFIECPVNKWVFIIENKVHSSQSKGQLKKYSEFVKRRYEDDNAKNENKIKIDGIFLTLNEEEPDDEELDIKFHSIRYSDVVVLLNQVIMQFKESVSIKVINFIKYYLETISELCEMNEKTEDMKKLARKVYQENKAVIDFIVEHSSSTEFQYAVSLLKFSNGIEIDPEIYDEFSVGEEDFIYFTKNKKLFSFLPKSWISELGEVKRIGKENINSENYLWKGCEAWWASYPLICWIQLNQSEDNNGNVTHSLKLFAELGRLSNHLLRTRLIKGIESKKNKYISFVNKAKNEGTKYSKMLKYKQKQPAFEIPIIDSQDSSDLKDKMEVILENFSKLVLPDVKEALAEFMSTLTIEIEKDMSP